MELELLHSNKIYDQFISSDAENILMHFAHSSMNVHLSNPRLRNTQKIESYSVDLNFMNSQELRT